MNKIFFTVMAVTVLASCATPATSDKAERYLCDNGMQAAFTPQDKSRNSGTLTLSQVLGGNVEARSLTLERVSHPVGAAWGNAAEQTQWVDLGSNVELTYPVSGVVRLFTCRRTAP